MADPDSRDEDRSYDPSTPETNRSIDQGNGVGARDLDRQASPTRRAEHDPFKTVENGVEKDNRDLPTPPGQNDFA